jgi:ATP-dependent Lhr-like helicase
VQVWLPEEEPGRGRVAQALAEFLVARVLEDRELAGRAGLLISTVNGVDVAESVMARALLEAGFVAGAKGFNVRRVAVRA